MLIEEMTLNGETLKVANFEVTENWSVDCPNCCQDQEAPFNHDNPMQPMKMQCFDCGDNFIVTYDRDT